MSIRQSSRRVVRFKEDDDVVMYDQVVYESPPPSPLASTPSPPISTPSPSMTHATNSSEGPQTPPNLHLPLTLNVEGVPRIDQNSSGNHIPQMSQHLLAALQWPWNISMKRGDCRWDDYPATVHQATHISLHFPGLPCPIFVQCPANVESLTVGNIFRTIKDALSTQVTLRDAEYAGLDNDTKAKIVDSFYHRQARDPNAQFQRIDYLLGKHILFKIVPYPGSKGAWKVECCSEVSY